MSVTLNLKGVRQWAQEEQEAPVVGAEGFPAEPSAQGMDWHLQRGPCDLAGTPLQHHGVANVTSSPPTGSNRQCRVSIFEGWALGVVPGALSSSPTSTSLAGCGGTSMPWWHQGLSQADPNPALFLLRGFTLVGPPELWWGWGEGDDFWGGKAICSVCLQKASCCAASSVMRSGRESHLLPLLKENSSEISG